jgi:hypothetical protein
VTCVNNEQGKLWVKERERVVDVMCVCVYLSSDRPQARTLMLGSRPMGSSISGLNMPEFPISIHFFRPGWKAKISMLGSV